MAPAYGNFASCRADLPPQKVTGFLVEIARLHDQQTLVGISSRNDIQFENVFDSESFIHLDDSRASLKLRHRSDVYLLNVPTLRFKEKTCS